MDFTHIAALIIFLFPLAYSPGPGNAFFASIGASRGLRAAMPSLFGYHVATFIVTMAIGLGLEAAVLSNPIVMKTLSLIGGAYVIWIGFQFIGVARSNVQEGEINLSLHQKGVSFVDGAVVLLLNPKAYVIIGLLFTQFLKPSEGRFAQVFGITTIFTLNNLLAFVVWTLGGVVIAAMLKGQTAHRNLNFVFGVCLIAVGIWMIWPAI